MSSVPMPRDLSEEAVREWTRAVSDCDVPAHNCRSCLNTARAVLALVREKVREAVELDRMNLHLCDDDVVALAMGRPLPPPDCKTCFGCGYIPGTYERPTCDACGGTGKEVPRG